MHISSIITRLALNATFQPERFVRLRHQKTTSSVWDEFWWCGVNKASGAAILIMGHSAQCIPDDHELNTQHQKILSFTRSLQTSDCWRGKKCWCWCFSAGFFSFSHSIHMVEGGMGGSEERKWHTEERIKSWWKKIHEKQLGIQHLCCFFFFFNKCFFSHACQT